MPFAIPNDQGLIGVQLYNQFAEVRPTSPDGVVMTNGGSLVVQ